MAKKEPIVKETVQERETYRQVKRHYYIARENVEAPIGGGEGVACCGLAPGGWLLVMGRRPGQTTLGARILSYSTPEMSH